jgi:transposase
MPFIDTHAMNDHLAEIAGATAPAISAHMRLSCRTTSPLSPYSPELNPIENGLQYLRANWLAITVFDDDDAIVDTCCRAWNHFPDRPDIE